LRTRPLTDPETDPGTARGSRGRCRRPDGLRRSIAALLFGSALVLPAASLADGSTFFGPSQGLEIQPELNLYHHVGDAFRLLLRVDPTFIPSQSYAEMGAGVYAAWLVAPFAGPLLSPDIAKRRRLDVRLGASWYPTTSPGTSGWSDVLELEGEATVRESLPGEILVTLRSRVEARWQLDLPTSFIWRLRLRPQLEREFPLSREAGSSLTPFLGAEFIWTTAQDMWSQFRMLVGLQLGVHWFGTGQVIEVNASVFTYLQPSRSYSPVIGAVWYQYF